MMGAPPNFIRTSHMVPNENHPNQSTYYALSERCAQHEEQYMLVIPAGITGVFKI